MSNQPWLGRVSDCRYLPTAAVAVQRGLLLIGSMMALSACTVFSTANPDDVGPYPDNYRDIVKAEIQADYFDPSSLQDFFIAEPFMGRLMFKDGWVVCFRVNAKNQEGGYTGEQEHAYLINNGVVVQQGDQAGCPNAQYSEWTEMEGAGLKFNPQQ